MKRMETLPPKGLLAAYGISEAVAQPIGHGLIHHTWKIVAEGRGYVLQRLNTDVFPEPRTIARNVRLIGDYLKSNFPGYVFVRPLPNRKGEDLTETEAGCFRLFPFVEGSHAPDVASTPAQAYEAAKQFGRFARLLSGFDAGQLGVTIPQFHDLGLRCRQFDAALRNGNRERIEGARQAIEAVRRHSGILHHYEALLRDGGLRLRVTHHDTKISNVLFDEDGKGLCVIDLDTVMPGYFISDLGDMMRTYLSGEGEEAGAEGVRVREEFYRAVVDGYLSEMGDALTDAERAEIFFSGQFMICMQAVRFLTDHLNNDSYYGARYEGHNLARARNQLALLEDYTAKKTVLNAK